jgi:serine/threonine protein kinase
MVSNVTLNETTERNITSKPTPTQSRRRRASNAALSPPDRLKKRDIEFMHQTVSVVQKIGEFGSSYFYSARSDTYRRRRNQIFLIKATVVATKDQAQRAEEEVRLLRRMRGSTGIPTIIDCGFSTIEERSFEYQTEGDHLDARRLYCVLIDPCPELFLSEFIKRRRLKYKTKTSRSLFTMRKKSAIWNGYLPIDIILDIFGQMVSAVKALHSYHDEDSRETTGHTEECVNFEVEDYGRLHLDIQPSRFLIRKRKTRGFEKESYDVTLCSFGSSNVGNVKLTSEADKRIAGKLIESYSSQKYRSPEMIDLNLSMELTTRYVYVCVNIFVKRLLWIIPGLGVVLSWI